MKKYIPKSKIFVLCLTLSFLASSFSFAAQTNLQQDDLKKKIDDLRNQIDQYQEEIDAKSDQAETLQGDISELEKSIAKIELQMQETQLVIQNLDFDISTKEAEISDMQKQVDAKKKMLGTFMQDLYERGETTPVEMALGSETFSDYFSQADSLESFEERTREIYEQYLQLRNNLKKEREDLIGRKEEQMNLRAMQNDQQNALDAQRATKDSLLGKTQNEQQALSDQMGKVQEQLNALQSLGEPINIDEAVAAARFASKLTNVAPEFLLGVLRVESGLGTNVGGGNYKKDMNPAQWDTFKKICKDLGINPDKAPVSRRVCYNSDSKDGCGGWGGAMGPAQMMPSTWTGYASQVEKATGKSSANPWDLEDSLVAMGLKLAAVDGVTKGNRKAWAKAAAMYLAGGAWEDYSWYSDRVLSYADGFKKIMK